MDTHVPNKVHYHAHAHVFLSTATQSGPTSKDSPMDLREVRKSLFGADHLKRKTSRGKGKVKVITRTLLAMSKTSQVCGGWKLSDTNYIRR